MTHIVGLDLSLTATGIATDADTALIRYPKARGESRLVLVRDDVVRLASHADLVLIEGYSFASRQGGEHLGELGGVIRVALWERHIPFVEIAPKVLKKFATGNGNANKDAVLVAAVRAGFEGDDNNAADAWWLRQIGVYQFSNPGSRRRTLGRDEAVNKIVWPALLGDEVTEEGVA